MKIIGKVKPSSTKHELSLGMQLDRQQRDNTRWSGRRGIGWAVDAAEHEQTIDQERTKEELGGGMAGEARENNAEGAKRRPPLAGEGEVQEER